MTYWDSSAIIAAIQNLELAKKTALPNQATRIHSLAEVFSTLTGGRLGIQFTPNNAAAMIDRLTQNFRFVELNQKETMQALKQSQARGIRGRRVHYWLHAVAAKKIGAKELITENISDFKGLEDGFKLVKASRT